jgi:EmrB/QacA subfamily drug resistance transporter
VNQHISPAQLAPVRPDIAQSHRWIALSVMVLGVFMAIMDAFIVNIALPSIRADLGASVAQSELVIAGYGLTYAVFLITAGRLGDLYGRRRMLVTGLGGFTLASVFCGVAPTANALIAMRLLQGLAASLIFPQVLSLIRVTFIDAQERAAAFGVMGAVQGAASIAGQILGGVIVHADVSGLGWRPVFLINLPLGLVAACAAAWVISESRSSAATQLDLTGVVLSAAGLSLLLYPLIEGREAGWPLWILSLLAVSAPVLLAFAAHQHQRSRRGASPLLHTRLFNGSAFALGVAAALLLYTAMPSLYMLLAFLLQSGFGHSSFAAALIFTPIAVVYCGASLVANRFALRFGRLLLVAGGAAITLGLALTSAMAWRLGAGLDGPALLAGMLLVGLGQGLIVTQLLNLILSTVSSADVGAASGLVSTMQQVGGAIGIAIAGIFYFGALEGMSGEIATATAHAHAFAIALIYDVAAVAVTTLLLMMLPTRRRDQPAGA